MAASPSSVLTRGLGVWGSVNLLPTLGLGIGTASTAILSVPVSATLTRRGPCASSPTRLGPTQATATRPN